MRPVKASAGTGGMKRIGGFAKGIPRYALAVGDVGRNAVAVPTIVADPIVTSGDAEVTDTTPREATEVARRTFRIMVAVVSWSVQSVCHLSRCDHIYWSCFDDRSSCLPSFCAMASAATRTTSSRGSSIVLLDVSLARTNEGRVAWY